MTILRRDVAFERDGVPARWCADDAYRTAFMSALSLLFPEGEKFFVVSVKQFEGDIKSPMLRADVRGFIGQEAMHGREHRAFNEDVIAATYPAARAVDARLRAFLQSVRRVLSPKSQLAATCALEHFTAILAEQLLGDPHMRHEIHASVRPMWLWHALEESEHKAVAFDVYVDVYVDVGGGYVRRVGIMMLATAIFFAVQATLHARLMAQDGTLWRPWRWLRGIQRMWITPGYFRKLIPAYLSYYRPSFHPDDRDARVLLDHWRDELFPRQAAA